MIKFIYSVIDPIDDDRKYYVDFFTDKKDAWNEVKKYAKEIFFEKFNKEKIVKNLQNFNKEDIENQLEKIILYTIKYEIYDYNLENCKKFNIFYEDEN